MERLSDLFRSKRIKQYKEWLRDHYQAYPKGIETFGTRRRGTAVTIKLSSPLDTEVFSSVVRDFGLTPVTEAADDGHQIVNVYKEIDYGGGKVGRRLQEVFHEEREIPIGSEPLDSGGSSRFRLELIAEYLQRIHD